MHPSANVDHLEGSATMAVAALCRQLKAEGRQILDLSAGEPDFRTPTFVAEAGIAAIEQGFTQYAPVPGIPQLREAIAQHLGRMCGREVSAAGVVVSVGAKQALFNACFCLFGPGDDVLIPVPYWTSYPEMVKLARARPVFAHCREADDLRITVADLEAAVTPKTRGLILNSPSNPSGIVYSVAELRAIVSWAAARGIIVISDEIYGRICFDRERAASVLDLEESLLANVILVDGGSKAFAMTGWRIGFSYSNPAVARVFADLQSHITSGACTPAQYAAYAAYRDEPRVLDAVQAMVRVFRRRRDAAIARLAERVPDITVTRPEGGFFLFLKVDSLYRDGMTDSVAFCHWLLDRVGVALVPGSAFGDERYVRLSFASPEAEILEAIDRIAAVAVESQAIV
jgi:aspartate aminotransferase